MARPSKSLSDNSLLEAALEGLQAQRQRIEEQIKQVQQLLGGKRAPRAAAAGPATAKAPASRKRRELSSAARKRIAAAQKKRWAEYRKQQKPE